MIGEDPVIRLHQQGATRKLYEASSNFSKFLGVLTHRGFDVVKTRLDLVKSIVDGTEPDSRCGRHFFLACEQARHGFDDQVLVFRFFAHHDLIRLICCSRLCSLLPRRTSSWIQAGVSRFEEWPTPGTIRTSMGRSFFGILLTHHDQPELPGVEDQAGVITEAFPPHEQLIVLEPSTRHAELEDRGGSFDTFQGDHQS